MRFTYSFGNDFRIIRLTLLDLEYNKTMYLSGEKNDVLDDLKLEWLQNIFENYNATFTFIST